MAAQPKTFPDKQSCSTVCNDVGAFKRINQPSKEETRQDVQATDTYNRHSEEPMPTTSQDRQSAGDFTLPELKPGPDGKIDWTPLGEMTRTRPPVSKYSLERYSLNEWRAHNESVLDPEVIVNSNIVDYNAKTAIMQAFGNIDKTQRENNKRLKQKARDIFRWKIEVERACKSITEEVELLEFERQRLKGASRTLMLPEAISRECLDLRSNRAIPDLVADLAEQELLVEMNLVKEVRQTFKVTLHKIEEQLVINKAAKHKIEYDWCDKTMAYNTEATNLSLTTKSPTILFRPGATRFGEFSAPLEYWEYFCRENILNVEAVRQKSQNLRGSINAILVQGGKKLRTQADKTDMALAETVAITQEILMKLEKTLLDTLQRIAELEKLIDGIQESVRKMDAAMKLAQTRLDNRNCWRAHGESVRDQPHLGLLEEVKRIHESVSALNGQLNNAVKVRGELMAKRTVLEKDIAAKRKTLNIDRDRCGMIRSHYPAASELAGR